MRNLRIALVTVVLALLALAWRVGLFARFATPTMAHDTLLALGPWAYLAFVLAYATLQPFGVPGTVFILVAPLVWPWPVAFALSMAGTMAASVVGFSFARVVGREWVSERIPARFRAYEARLAERGFATVFLLRLVFWMPPLLHAFFGVSRVSFWTHFWGSLAGYVLPLLLVSYFGQRLFDAMKGLSPEAWALGTLAVVATTAAAYGVARVRSARRARTA